MNTQTSVVAKLKLLDYLLTLEHNEQHLLSNEDIWKEVKKWDGTSRKASPTL